MWSSRPWAPEFLDGLVVAPVSTQMRDQGAYERIPGGEAHCPGSPRSLPASPLDAGVITVPATIVRLGWETEPESVGCLKADRPSGEARLPRGPDNRCRRTPTVANWTWASSPARIMRPPLHLPGNRRGGRSLPQARQSCQEPVGSPAVRMGQLAVLMGNRPGRQGASGASGEGRASVTYNRGA